MGSGRICLPVARFSLDVKTRVIKLVRSFAGGFSGGPERHEPKLRTSLNISGARPGDRLNLSTKLIHFTHTLPSYGRCMTGQWVAGPLQAQVSTDPQSAMP
jgi:hypothetical protein